MIKLYFGLIILNFFIFINLKKIANFVNIFDNIFLSNFFFKKFFIFGY